MNIGKEIKIVKKHKGVIKYSNEENFSSSSILNERLEEIKKYY